ncbi:hypothetical protein FLJC2902T_06320 [Flavobacterium limnosediminis JC2902]|uniref:Uncharacterized protein n=1 Tax=Flavobacterium limnosediminis JC2902 TaxID=1341181 RepID=V6SSU5_9FLAO|nr:hypothetical protein FLJC2902T_06320 [Flavobacterium limnosediminis JC2902]
MLFSASNPVFNPNRFQHCSPLLFHLALPLSGVFDQNDYNANLNLLK